MVTNMSQDSNRNKTSRPVKLASYGTVRVYKSNRIKLDVNLLNTLGIRPGDKVEVLLDTEKRAIIIVSSDERGNSLE